MPHITTTNGCYRFGVFEVDIKSRELRKRGIRIKLQDKPFEVLEALIEKPGEYVTREELADRLWADETPADINRNLNKAINKLRNALGDSPESPRFVETRPRMGYRFVAPVEAVEYSFDLEPDLEPEPTVRVQPETVLPPSPLIAEPAAEPQRPWSRKWIAGIGAGAAIAAAVVLFLSLRPPDSLRMLGSRQLTNDGRQKVGGIFTDGRHVYFSEFMDGRVLLARVSASGGETRFLETPFDAPASVFALDVNRDGEQLLVKTGSGVTPEINADPLWILSSSTGTARRLGDLLANDARWSPDGTQLAYSFGDQLLVCRSDGSSPKVVARKPGVNCDLSWTPDGRRLRFRSGFPGRYHTTLWEAPTDGRGLHQVFPDWEYEQQFGDWTPDGKHFIFYSPTDFRLWSSREEWPALGRGPSPSRLSSGPMRFLHPRFVRGTNTMMTVGEIRRGELLRWDSAAENFEPYRPGLSADQLDFSRDGKWVTYIAFPENVLWRSHADGTNRLQLTNAPMQAYLPRYSPDGRQIAFMARLPNARWRIYLIPADGGTPRQMLTAEGTESDPSWSPDGKQIAFAPFPWEVERSDTGIRVLDFATGKVQRISGSQDLFSPRWSPNGRYIFALHSDGEPRLYDFNSGDWTAFPLQGGFPAWSRDGRYVYVFHAFTRDRGIYRFEIATRRAEKVASLEGTNVAGILGPYGLSLGPDDSPIILRDLSIQEIYAFDLK